MERGTPARLNLAFPRADPSCVGGGGETEGGGSLIVGAARRNELLEQSIDLPSIVLTPRQLADLELLLNGAFAPLSGFMTGVEYVTVCCEMRLPNDRLWPMPVTLRVDEAVAKSSNTLALRDRNGFLVAVLHLEDVWQPDLLAEAAAVFGTIRDQHAGVATLASEPGEWCLGGRVEGLQLPEHHDFRDLRKTPTELQAKFAARGWRRVMALQTHSPLHRVDVEVVRRAAEQLDAGVLIHGAVGPATHEDLDPMTRVRCYRAALDSVPAENFELAVLPLAMRMAGPREALWHALIAKNFGCSHFIIGRDHAGPGVDSEGDPFYEPEAAQQLVEKHAGELGIEVVPFRELRWVPGLAGYRPEEEIPAGMASRTLSGTEMQRRLRSGKELPSWFTFPEVERILRDRQRQKGCVVFFDGLPGAGKSTVAGILASFLRERGVEVSLLDGDDALRHLSSDLHPGTERRSKERRDLDIRRIGFVAAEVARHGGIAICASFVPEIDARRRVQQMAEAHGRFVSVHVHTPRSVCEERDPKGHYRKVRAGRLPGLASIMHAPEGPAGAEVVVDTMAKSPEESAEVVLDHLVELGVVPWDTGGGIVIPAAIPRPRTPGVGHATTYQPRGSARGAPRTRQ